MTVTNVQKNIPKLDVLSTFRVLNYILRIFGLSCLYRDGDDLKWSWPFWRISFIISFFSITNMLMIYFKLKSIDGGILHITFKDTLQIIYLLRFHQYFVDIIFVYKFGRQSYIDYLKHYECIDDILGVSYYFGIKKSIRNWCVILFILGISTLATDYIAWSVSFNRVVPSSCFLDYLYIGLKILCVLDMVANFTNMNFRLEAMVDVLEDYYHHCENLPGVLKDVIGERLNICLDGFNTTTFNKCSVIKNMTRCYLLLIQQCDYVNSMYGVRIVVNSATFLIDMVMMMNLLIRLILGTMVTTYGSGLLPIISTATRIVSCSIILISCIDRCEQNYRQNDRLMRLIDHLLLKKIPSEVSESLKELRELIITSPVRYHAMNFFKLEYSTLVSIASIIVTYTIILLQNMK